VRGKKNQSYFCIALQVGPIDDLMSSSFYPWYKCKANTLMSGKNLKVFFFVFETILPKKVGHSGEFLRHVFQNARKFFGSLRVFNLPDNFEQII